MLPDQQQLAAKICFWVCRKTFCHWLSFNFQERESEFEGNGLIGAQEEVGFHPNEGIATIEETGSQKSAGDFHNEHIGDAWRVFANILQETNLVSDNSVFPK